jgi:hypothetical protein
LHNARTGNKLFTVYCLLFTEAAETDHSTEVETEETKVTKAGTGKSRDSVSKKVTVQGTGTPERETKKGRTEDVVERGNLKEQQKITTQAWTGTDTDQETELSELRNRSDSRNRRELGVSE